MSLEKDFIVHIGAELPSNQPEGDEYSLRITDDVSVLHNNCPLIETHEHPQFFLLIYGEIHANKDILIDVSSKISSDGSLKHAENLIEVEGNYVLVIIAKNSNSVYLARDKQGSKTGFYCFHQGRITISSNIYWLPQDGKYDSLGLFEAVNFRWHTGSHSLIKGISQIPAASITKLDPTNKTDHHRFLSIAECHHPLYNNIEQLAEEIESALDQYFEEVVTEKELCIPLGGGVDSAILAILAKRHGIKAHLLSLEMQGWHNPELEQAKRYAEFLQLSHEVIPFTTEDVSDYFERCCRDIMMFPRQFSALPFAKLLEIANAKSPAILYGESADGFFGWGPAVDTTYRLRKKFSIDKFPRPLLAIASSLPLNISKKLKQLTITSTIELAFENIRIHNQFLPEVIFNAIASTNLEDLEISSELRLQYEQEFATKSDLEILAIVKQLVLMSDVANHFETIERISHHSLKIYPPFYCARLVALSTHLSLEDYRQGNIAKPALKFLAAKYYPSEWVHIKKWGFPAPADKWLTGPLNNKVKELLNDPEFNKDGKLNQIDVAENFELFWMLISMREFNRNTKEARATR